MSTGFGHATFSMHGCIESLHVVFAEIGHRCLETVY